VLIYIILLRGRKLVKKYTCILAQACDSRVKKRSEYFFIKRKTIVFTDSNLFQYLRYRALWTDRLMDTLNIGTYRPVTRKQLRKQARNKYRTKDKADPFLGNALHTCTKQ
jgi:hypothetical protein